MHVPVRWSFWLLLLVCLPVIASDYRFDGSMPEEVLRSYHSRSMTTMYLLTGHGDFDDNLRMLTQCGVKFAGRAVYQWGREEGGESSLPMKLELARKNAARIHAADPELILQACIFYGRSRNPGEAGMGKFWGWGWDEITWFSQQPEDYRNQWLSYAWRWVRDYGREIWLGRWGSWSQLSLNGLG